MGSGRIRIEGFGSRSRWIPFALFILFLVIRTVKITTANVGSYPRVGEDREKQRLRRALNRWKQGELTDEELLEVQHSVIEEVINEQEETGLDQVTDGMIRWYCPFSHMCRKLKGVEINGLVRYFDTNFYFRQPKVLDEPEWAEPIVCDEFQFAREVSDRPLRQVLTGPYTLARFSITDGEETLDVSLEELTRQYARALAEEVANLWAMGAEYIQVEEHGIKDHPEHLELMQEGLGVIQESAGEATVSASFSYGSPPTVLPSLEELPVEEIVLDLVRDDGVLQDLTETSVDQDLVLGVINARNTKLEDPGSVSDWLSTYLGELDHDSVTISPSTGLELLPRNRAEEKLETLVSIKEKLNSSL